MAIPFEDSGSNPGIEPPMGYLTQRDDGKFYYERCSNETPAKGCEPRPGTSGVGDAQTEGPGGHAQAYTQKTGRGGGGNGGATDPD
jgi:hypothetical protein